VSIGRLVAEGIGEQAAGIRVPRELRILQALEQLRVGFKTLDRGGERFAPVRSVEVARQLEDRRIVQRRFAVEVSAGGKDEERAAKRRGQLLLGQRDFLPRDVGEDDEVQLRLRTRPRSRAPRRGRRFPRRSPRV
jgi:hypothetical protein